MVDRQILSGSWERYDLPYALRLVRTLHLPTKWKGRAIRLLMTGVGESVSLWIDGRRAYGEGDGILYEFDLTDHLYDCIRAQLTVELPPLSSVPGMTLVSSPAVSVAGEPRLCYLSAREDKHQVRLTCSLRSVLPQRKQTKVLFSLEDSSGKRLRKAERSVVLPPYGEGEAVVELTLSSLRFWSVDSPALYTLSVQILEGDRLWDQAEAQVGVCLVKTDARRGFLQNGVNLKWKCVPYPTSISEDIPASVPRLALSSLKEIGANVLLLRPGPQTEQVLRMCDRNGIGALLDLSDVENIRLPIRRYGGHVSLLGWQISSSCEPSARGERWLSRRLLEIRCADAYRPIGLLWRDGAPTSLEGVDFLTVEGDSCLSVRKSHPNKPQLLTGKPPQTDCLWSEVCSHAYAMGLLLTASGHEGAGLLESLADFPLLRTRYCSPVAYHKVACLWQSKRPQLLFEVLSERDGYTVYLYTNCEKASLSADGRPLPHPVRINERTVRYDRVSEFFYLDAVAFRGGKEVCRRLYERTDESYALRLEPLSLPRPFGVGEVAYFCLSVVDSEGRTVSCTVPSVHLSVLGDGVLDTPEGSLAHVFDLIEGTAAFGVRRTEGDVSPTVVAQVEGLHSSICYTHH